MVTRKSFRALWRFALVTFALLALFSLQSDGSDEALALESVTDAQLASAGITLKDPGPIGSTPVSAEAAVSTPGVPVRDPAREVKLARVIAQSPVPPIDRVVWVVIRVPETNTPPTCFGCGGLLQSGWTYLPGGFSLSLIDPYSGEELSTLAVGGGLIPPKDWPPEGWSVTGFD